MTQMRVADVAPVVGEEEGTMAFAFLATDALGSNSFISCPPPSSPISSAVVVSFVVSFVSPEDIVGGVSGEEAEAEREAETAEGGGGECRILGVGSTSSLESLLSNASATNISASVMAAIVLVKALRVVWRASARGGVWCGWSGPYLTHNPNLQEKVFF